MSSTRLTLPLALVGVVAVTLSAQQPAAPPPARGTPPRLVLVLAIDQMRFDYLTRFAPLYTRGLRMLLDRGAVFTNAKYRHAATETGPGHSVILTGRHPSHSGIVGNDWYDPYLEKPVNVVEDPVHRPVEGTGRNASPVNLIGFTVGDLLKASVPGSRVVAVSLKDRSAILMGGRRADAAYWYETGGGNFITSTYYMPEAPWLRIWNARRLADRYAGRLWTRLIADPAVYEQYAGNDAIEGEWDRKDTVFPHRVRNRPPAVGFYDDLRRTPFGDELTLDMALGALDAHSLGRDASTDVFAIGFASTDVVGHTYGPDSHETMDQLLHLDRLLGTLFDEIETRIGLANTVVVLTADHGAASLIENARVLHPEARRAPTDALQKPVREALEQRFPGTGSLIVYSPVPDFYLNEALIRERGLNRDDVERTAIDALMATGLVANVYTHAMLRAASASNDPFLPLFLNGFYEPRSPHLTVLLKPHVYVSNLPGGTGHGTAYDYDRHVPVMFMGPGIVPGFYDAPAGPEDIAPTLGLILGLEFPPEHDARVLTEMLPVPAN
jgi:predicted AlkP superfamily pyrophosphatase or phosphodiesterase